MFLSESHTCLSDLSYKSSSTVTNTSARSGGTEVAGWTLDRKIRVRFPAYLHRVWALWWQGGKRRLRTSQYPCRGRLGALKTPGCPWRGCPAAGQNLETGHLPRHYIAEISLKPKSTTTNTSCWSFTWMVQWGSTLSTFFLFVWEKIVTLASHIRLRIFSLSCWIQCEMKFGSWNSATINYLTYFNRTLDFRTDPIVNLIWPSWTWFDQKRLNYGRFNKMTEAKSRKYQGVFEVKSRVKTW